MTASAEFGRRRSRSDDGAGKPAPSTLSYTEQCGLAHEAALRLLSVRERSASELRLRLRKKGFSSEPIESVLERLAEVGLQDDRRFAAAFASDAADLRGVSARRIQLDLRARGVDPELAAAAATVHPDEEETRARDLARKRARGMSSLAPEVRARRLIGLLARRGYPADICRRVANEVAGARGEDDEAILDLDSERDVR